jgi:arylsulfatase
MAIQKADAKKRNGKSPNIVLILIDDFGYGDVGCYGATGFQTPNIDGLANDGMRFTNFYAAQPVCSASRAGLLTGCYPNRIGFHGALMPDDKIGMNASEYTLAEMLKEKGYVTKAVGKWHLGHYDKFMPLKHGFDEFYGLPYSNDMWPRDNVSGEKVKPKSKRAGYCELPLMRDKKTERHITSMDDQAQLTTWYTENAVSFIEKNADQPFFLYFSHSMGHVPLGVSDKFKGKSEQGRYGDVVMELDWSVGEIVRVLKQKGIEDNTLLIFTSDNGPWLNYGNHAGSTGGLREGKSTSWEGGQRVPMIIKYPGYTPSGRINNDLTCAIDILPTLTKIVGGQLSDNKIDGIDVSEMWQGKVNAKERDHVLFYYGDNFLNGIRKGNWKLVLPHEWKSYETKPGRNGKNGRRISKQINELELYDLTRDPSERYNVAKLYPKKVKELMIDVEKARQELGDSNVGIDRGSNNREIGKL